jgi:uncharacterized membrane protein (DUF106 family)
MTTLNTVLRAVLEPLMSPLAGLPPLLGVVLWSIPTGVLALLAFKWTSNQERITAAKRRIQAGLFEIRLFNDDLRAILRAQVEIMGQVLRYQAHALKPMIFILPPLLLLMVHLHAYYGFRALHPGEDTILRLVLDEAPQDGQPPEVTLHLPSGLHAATPPVWVPALGEYDWRIAVDRWGSYDVRFSLPGAEVTKRVQATDRIVAVSPVRPRSSLLDQLEWPVEAPLAASSPVREITVAYPEATFDLLGWRFQWRYAWMTLFFVLTMIIAFALKGPLKVEL